MSEPGARHGLAGTYRNSAYGCRCEECKAANTARAKAERADRRARLAGDPSLAVHGLAATYRNWGCRCESCSQAHSADLKVRNAQRKIDGTMRFPASYYLRI